MLPRGCGPKLMQAIAEIVVQDLCDALALAKFGCELLLRMSASNQVGSNQKYKHRANQSSQAEERVLVKLCRHYNGYRGRRR